jgi:chitin synthase
MAGVGFLTFGFTQTVCGKPPNRFHGGAIGDTFIGKSSVTINGYDYDLGKFNHPAAGSTFDGKTNPLFAGGWNVAGNDISFLFQNVNQKCLGLITKAPNSPITGSGNNLDWYFPCNVINQDGSNSASGNQTNNNNAFSCHTQSSARTQFHALKPQGQVYFTWDDVSNPKRNLAVYES